MKIDPNDYLTIKQTADALGTNNRGVYRALARARAEGAECLENILGRSVVHRKKVETLKRFFFPIYGENHQAMVKEWGRRGGATKAANREKQEKTAAD
jgi:hypothetical protein